MISKPQEPIRVFGRRSIDSTFRKLPSDSSTSSNDLKGNEGKQASHKSNPVSLSDFLDRKLKKSSLVLEEFRTTIGMQTALFSCLVVVKRRRILFTVYKSIFLYRALKKCCCWKDSQSSFSNSTNLSSTEAKK